MKQYTYSGRFTAVAMAVALLTVSLQVRADDEEAQALKIPSNSVELGVISVDHSSAKYGEYNGLNNSGQRLIGNFNLKNQDGYKNNEEGENLRWSIRGDDLGLSNRSLGATIGRQGEWGLGLNYDELKHQLSDTYQTPYQGDMGGNSYQLPAGYTAVTTSGTGVPGTNSLSAAQLAAMRNLDIQSSRRHLGLQGSMVIDSSLSLNVDYKRLAQTGAKLQGFGTAAATGSGAAGEAVSILPMPTNYKTDTIQVGLNWLQGDANASVSYYGSYFRDQYEKVNFQSYAGAVASQWMTTPPNNDFHQLNFQGGYRLSPKTRVVGNYSYGRNTQSSAYLLPEAGLMLSAPPVSELGGLVVNTHADMKLTHLYSKQLTLTGALRYDERDNQTPSNVYSFTSIGVSASHNQTSPNVPLSNRKGVLELAGDYRFQPGHNLRLAYSHEDLNRYCNQYASVSATQYPAGIGCVVAKSSRDDKLDLGYRIKPAEGVDLRVGYGFSHRVTQSDPYAQLGFVSVVGAVTADGLIPQIGAAVGAIPATNTTPKGQNAGDYYGFYPFFTASRNQQMLRFSSNWQLTEQVDLMLGARWTDDRYPTGTYGVQKGNSVSLNADTNYQYSEDGLITLFMTQQVRQRDLTDIQRSQATASAATATAIGYPAFATWTNTLKDEDLTVGLGFRQAGLLQGRLELTGDVAYTHGKTGYTTQLNYTQVPTTTGGATCASAQILSCGPLPEITSSITRFKLGGVYQVDKSNKVVLRYIQQRFNSTDYYYNGLQYGYTPSSLMPTNQQSPNFSIRALAATYVMNF